jgi:Putative member of DMT superfamily (DUF486)/ABC transporter
MRVLVTTIGLLTLSNVFMTFAWYAHLRNLADKPWYIAAVISWGIAFFEYMLQVPAKLAISLRGVTKTFGSTVAVDNLDLAVPKGALYGFIGPNGAGKTTTLRMIMSILFPDRGELSVLGKPAAIEAKDHPNSVFATVLSFVPPMNGFAMLLRMTSTSPPPMWQVWLSIAVGVAAAMGGLWFASRIFKIGLLMHGRPPNFATLIKWARQA